MSRTKLCNSRCRENNCEWKQLPKTSRLRKTPIWHEDISLNADTFIDDLPYDYNSILGWHDEKLWLKEIDEELQSFDKNNT